MKEEKNIGLRIAIRYRYNNNMLPGEWMGKNYAQSISNESIKWN